MASRRIEYVNNGDFISNRHLENSCKDASASPCSSGLHAKVTARGKMCSFKIGAICSERKDHTIAELEL